MLSRYQTHYPIDAAEWNCDRSIGHVGLLAASHFPGSCCCRQIDSAAVVRFLRSLKGAGMTICVAVKVHDCLVFAADSASSIVYNVPSAPPQIGRVYEHGNKVFNLLRGAPICAMTSGLGNIGSASISSIAKDFRRLATDTSSPWYIDPKHYSMDEVAEKVRAYIFDERITNAGLVVPPSTSLQFWVGGYGSADQNPEVWQVLVEGRGGRVCLHRDWRRISGSSAGCFLELPVWSVMQGGRSPTGVMPKIDGQCHAAIARGRLSKYVWSGVLAPRLECGLLAL